MRAIRHIRRRVRRYRSWLVPKLAFLAAGGVLLSVVVWAVGDRRIASPSPASGVDPEPAQFPRPDHTLLRARAMRDAGDYARVLSQVTGGEGPSGPGWKNFREELLTPLKVDLRLHYECNPESCDTPQSPDDTLQLAHSVTKFYLTVDTRERCFLYILILSGDTVALLSDQAVGSPQFSPGSYRLPAGSTWLPVGSGTTQRVVLLAARWRLDAIEQLISRGPEAFDSLVDRIALEERLTEIVPGLIVGSYIVRGEPLAPR